MVQSRFLLHYKRLRTAITHWLIVMWSILCYYQHSQHGRCDTTSEEIVSHLLCFRCPYLFRVVSIVPRFCSLPVVHLFFLLLYLRWILVRAIIVNYYLPLVFPCSFTNNTGKHDAHTHKAPFCRMLPNAYQ